MNCCGPPLRSSSSKSSLIRVERSVVAHMLRIEQLDRRARHYRRNGVLIDQLGLRIAAQQQAEVIEPGDHALQLDAVHEEDRDRDFLLADVVEKSILKVLRFFAGHFWPLFAFVVQRPWPQGR